MVFACVLYLTALAIVSDIVPEIALFYISGTPGVVGRTLLGKARSSFSRTG
jgi:hypothetical protein